MKIFSPFKVGLIVIISIISFISFNSFVKKNITSEGKNNYYIELDDSSGIVKNSNVKIAGINVGFIENIELNESQTKAKLTIAVNKNIKLKKDSVIIKKQSSIMGDNFLELVTGNSKEDLLPDSEIKNKIEAVSINGVVEDLKKITNNLNDISEKLKIAVNENTLTSLNNTIKNLELITFVLSGLLSDKKDDILKTIDDAKAFFNDMKEVTPQNIYKNAKDGILNIFK